MLTEHERPLCKRRIVQRIGKGNNLLGRDTVRLHVELCQAHLCAIGFS